MSLLTTQGLVSHYGDFQALYGLDFAISSKETVAIIGSNGAGKSTFLRSIVGLINNASDQIQFKGEAIGDRPADEIVRYTRKTHQC